MSSPAAAPAAGPRKMRDPEHLNEAIHLTSRSTWILLATLGLCVAGVAAWGFFGRLTFHAKGPGVILLDNSVVSNVVARAGGTVTDIHVKLGQTVGDGDVLVTVKLDETLERRNQARTTLDAQIAERDRYAAVSRDDIARRKADVEQQQKSLQASLAEADKNLEILRRLYADAVALLARGLTTRSEMQSIFDRLTTVQQNRRDMIDRTSTIVTSQIEFEDNIARNIADLRMRVISAESTLADLDVQLAVGATIRSPVAGTVSEITTQVNSTVSTGLKLVVVEAASATKSLLVHGYLPNDQGKRVIAGMTAQVIPTSVDQQIYGSIRGTVTRVSGLPMSREGLLAVLGDDALVTQMMIGGAPIEVEIALESDPATVSGLRWTSSVGPPSKVTPGTTVAANIIFSSVRPIELVLPILETWTHL